MRDLHEQLWLGCLDGLAEYLNSCEVSRGGDS